MTDAADSAEEALAGLPDVRRAPLPARMAAQILSFAFHPILIPVYASCFMLFVHPTLFAGYTLLEKTRLAATITVNLCFLPAFTVFLAWRLKFTRSMYLHTQKERIIPLAAAMIFYFWCWYVIRGATVVPELFRQFLLGSFITIIAGWLANIYFKISLHGLALGGAACFMLLLAGGAEGFSAVYICWAIFIAGAVSTARLIVSDHHPFEVYAGLLLGAFCQVAAQWLN